MEILSFSTHNLLLLLLPHLMALMYAEQIRKIGDQPLRDILKTLGGWPVIEPDWKPPNISIETLMGKLRGEYSEPVLIELYVGADDKNSSINILQVSPNIHKKTFFVLLQFILISACFHLVGSASSGFAFKRLLSQVKQSRRP